MSIQLWLFAETLGISRGLRRRLSQILRRIPRDVISLCDVITNYFTVNHTRQTFVGSFLSEVRERQHEMKIVNVDGKNGKKSSQ